MAVRIFVVVIIIIFTSGGVFGHQQFSFPSVKTEVWKIKISLCENLFDGCSLYFRKENTICLYCLWRLSYR